jgi:hypothetical protein
MIAYLDYLGNILVNSGDRRINLNIDSLTYLQDHTLTS